MNWEFGIIVNFFLFLDTVIQNTVNFRFLRTGLIFTTQCRFCFNEKWLDKRTTILKLIKVPGPFRLNVTFVLHHLLVWVWKKICQRVSFGYLKAVSVKTRLAIPGMCSSPCVSGTICFFLLKNEAKQTTTLTSLTGQSTLIIKWRSVMLGRGVGLTGKNDWTHCYTPAFSPGGSGNAHACACYQATCPGVGYVSVS